MDDNDQALTAADMELLIEALRYSRMRFETYEYHSEEIRRRRLAQVDELVAKLKRSSY